MEKTFEEKVPVTIYATDSKGEMFAEDTSTHTLAKGWIKIPIRHKVDKGSEIIVFNKSNGNQAEFVIEGQDGALTKAVLKDISIDIWEKNFGEAAAPAPVAQRSSVHMVCKTCGSRESVLVTEEEKKKVLGGEPLWRHCASCVTERDWESEETAAARKPQAPAMPSALKPSAAPPAPEPPPPPPPAPEPAAPAAPEAPVLTGAERRTSKRIQMKTTARIRRASGGMEVLAPQNVSRGGIAFTSRGSYELDEAIFVAMHYRPGGEVLETPGVIVRVSQQKAGFGYGVRFT